MTERTQSNGVKGRVVLDGHSRPFGTVQRRLAGQSHDMGVAVESEEVIGVGHDHRPESESLRFWPDPVSFHARVFDVGGRLGLARFPWARLC